jgi:hypothetical protein
METKRTIAVLALVLAAAGCSGGGGGSGGGASIAAATSATAPTVPMNVTLRSSTTTVGAGQTVDLALSASQVSGLYGAGVDLAYDPDLLEYRSVSDGGFVAGATVGAGLRGRQPGVVTIAASAEGASAGATGSGDVVVVRFLARKAGLATITPTDAILEDAAGNQGVAPALGPVTISIN